MGETKKKTTRRKRTEGGKASEKPEVKEKKPRFSDLDQYLFGQATHYEIFWKMGAHPDRVDGKAGTWFTVWAPHAQEVSVVGDFNNWTPGVHRMELTGNDGVYELFIPGVTEGVLYKYCIKARDGRLLFKADPYAFAAEKRPGTASKVARIDGYKWGDDRWMENRKNFDPKTSAMTIYEVHPGSWMKHPWSEANPEGFYN